MLISQVSDADAVQQAIADVAKDFGKIDVFIANAGTNGLGTEEII